MGRHIQEEKLVDFVLGNVSAKEHFKIVAHLSSCDQCADACAYWESILEAEPVSAPPRSVWHRIVANVKNWQQQLKYQYLYLAGSLIAILFITFAYFQLNEVQPVIEQTEEQIAIQNVYDLIDHIENGSQYTLPTDQVSYFVNAQKFNIKDAPWRIQPIPIHMLYRMPKLTKDEILQFLEIRTSLSNPIFAIHHESIYLYDSNQDRLIIVKLAADPSRKSYIHVDTKTIDLNNSY